jgi:hypothetical protein
MHPASAQAFHFLAGTDMLSSHVTPDIRASNMMKHVCVAARIGDGKAPGEANTLCIGKTSNAASADSGCNPSGCHEFWPMALSKASCLE